VSKKSAEAERRARVAEMRKQQESAERRRTMLIAGIAGAVVLALVGVVVFVIIGQLKDRDITRVGVPTAAAKCDKTITDKTAGASVHVGPGTDQPDKVTIKYATVPPTSGEHYAQPEYPARAFYSEADRPKMETLVHNLEHGYTVLWYAPDLPTAKIDQLRKIGDLARRDAATGAQKFIVSAWDPAYGALPSGKTVALSHWGVKGGYRQLCGDVSGTAVREFVQAHPASDSTEPNGA
jgi:hypothetical protein